MSPSPRTLTTFLVAIAISLTTQTAFAAPNTPPVANNDTAPTTVNTPVNIAVLANDTPASGNPIDPKSVKIARKPSNGVATVLSNGQIRYTPEPLAKFSITTGLIGGVAVVQRYGGHRSIGDEAFKSW